VRPELDASDQREKRTCTYADQVQLQFTEPILRSWAGAVATRERYEHDNE